MRNVVIESPCSAGSLIQGSAITRRQRGRRIDAKRMDEYQQADEIIA